MSNVRRGVAWTSFGSLASLVLLFLETAIAARLLPTDEYGAYVLLVAVANAGLAFLDFGMKATATQLIATGDPERRQRVARAAFGFRLFVLGATAALGWAVVAGAAALGVSLPGEYLVYAPLMFAAASLDELMFSLLQGYQLYRPIAVAQTIRAVGRLGLTGALLAVFHLGPLALVAAWCVSYAASSAWQYRALPERPTPTFERPVLREMLGFGAPIQVTRILSFVANRAHVFLLGGLAGPAAAAFYGVAARIPDALQVVADSYTRVYFPTVASLLARGQKSRASEVLAASITLGSFGGAAVALFGVLFSREIVTIVFSAKYADAAPTFGLLMLAWQSGSVLALMGWSLTAVGRPGRSALADVVCAVVTVVADLTLIPLAGVAGAGLAALLSDYAGFPVSIHWLRRERLDPAAAAQARAALALALCVGLYWWTGTDSLVARAALLALFGAFALASSRRYISTILPISTSAFNTPAAARAARRISAIRSGVSALRVAATARGSKLGAETPMP